VRHRPARRLARSLLIPHYTLKKEFNMGAVSQLFSRITRDRKVTTAEMSQVRDLVNADGKVDVEERQVLAQLDKMLRQDGFERNPRKRVFDDGAASIMRNDMREAQGVKPMPGSLTLTDKTTGDTFEFGKFIESKLDEGVASNPRGPLSALGAEVKSRYDANRELAPSPSELLSHYEVEAGKPYVGAANEAIAAAAAQSGRAANPLYVAAKAAIRDAAIAGGKSERVADYLAERGAISAVSAYLGRQIRFNVDGAF
jgi:hypothetical protein